MEIQVMFSTGSTNVAGFNMLMGFKPSTLAKDIPNYHVPNSLFRYVLIRDVVRIQFHTSCAISKLKSTYKSITMPHPW